MRIVQTVLAIAVGLAGCQKTAHAPVSPAADVVTADADPIPVTQEDDGEPWPILSTEFLDLVPAETPYVFAHSEPVPRDVVKKLEPVIAPFVTTLEEGFAKEAKTMDAVDKRLIDDLFGGTFTVAGLEKIGVDLNPRFVIYGLGFAPVFRVRLGDGPTFERAFERINAASSRPLDISTFHGQRYFHTQSADGSLTALSIVGPDVVFTVLPPGDIQRELLPLAFGQKLPARSLGADGRLATVRAEHRLGPHLSGYVDIQASLIAIYGHGDDLNRRVAASYPSLVKAQSAECVADALRIAKAVPRFVYGYGELSTKRLVGTAVLEIDDAIARHMKSMPGPIPGLGDKPKRGSISAFGFGIDMAAVERAANAYSKAVEAEPFRCADFSAFNEIGRSFGAGLMFLPKPLRGITGFSVDVDDFSPDGERGIDGVFVLGIEDPKAALAAIGELAPTLAVEKLRKRRTPVPLASLLPQGAAPEVLLDNGWVAFGGRSIGVALGKAGKRALLDALDRERRGDRTLALWAMNMAPWVAKHREAIEATTDPDARRFISGLASVMGRTSFELRTTDRGLEMDTVLVLP